MPVLATLALKLNASAYRSTLFRFKRMREYDKHIVFKLNNKLAKQIARLAKHNRVALLEFNSFENNAAMYCDVEVFKLCNQFEPLNDIEQMVYLMDMLEITCFDLFNLVFEDDPDDLHDLCNRRY